MSFVQAPSPGAALPLPAPHPGGPSGVRHAAPAPWQARLSLEQISSILWAATGRARYAHGRAALPPASWREVDLYALLPGGTYHYDPAGHRLWLVTPDDLRALVDNRSPAPAPLLLVYVAAPDHERESAWEECGVLPDNDALHVSQNVAAHCAAAGLVCALSRGSAVQLGPRLSLPRGHRIVMVQRIGVPPAGAH